MKKALLWLSTLACLTVAGLYAYAWFNRDPNLAKFERVQIGMTMDKVRDAIGPVELKGKHIDIQLNEKTGQPVAVSIWSWSSEHNRFEIRMDLENRSVISKNFTPIKGSFITELWTWLKDSASMWRRDEFGVDIGLQAPVHLTAAPGALEDLP